MGVLALLCLLAAILYLDRICISQALKSIKDELELTNTQGSYILMAFTIAYGLFEVPSGWWGDRIGARRVLTRISIWWSIFTALTGACTGLWMLLAVRFLFGAGEAGAYPNSARVLARWFPDAERGRAQGVLITASQLGGVAAPTLAALLINSVGWRMAFVVFGAVGVVWAAGFYWWFRDDPAEHSAVSSGELKHIRQSVIAAGPTHTPIPWRGVLASPSIWILGAIMTCAAFNSYFYYSWFPTYLKSARNVAELEAGRLNSLVLAGAAIGTFSGGFAVDRLLRRRQNDLPRKLYGAIAYASAFAFLFFAVRCQSPRAMAALAAASSLAMSCTLPMWWSCAIGVSGRHVGSLFGLMNMLGVFGALGSQYFVGLYTDWAASRNLSGRAQWDPLFGVYMLVLLAGAVAWGLYRTRPVEPPHEPHKDAAPKTGV